MTLQHLSVASVYLTTLIWCAIYAWAYVECWREYRADKRELSRIKALSLLILIPLASDRFKRARYFLMMVHARVLVGLLAAYLLYLIPPIPDASPFQTLLRIVFILDAWWFLQAKRTDRGSRQRSRELRGE